MPMATQAARLSDLKIRAAKPADKDHVLTDGNGLQMRVRSNGSKLWDLNYRQPLTRNRVNRSRLPPPTVSLRAGAQVRKLG